MKLISRLKIGAGGDACRRHCCGGRQMLLGPLTDSYLAYRERVTAKVGSVWMEGQAGLDKKYAAEMYAGLGKLVGTVKMKGFSVNAGSNVQSALTDDGMAPGPDGLFLKSNDGKINRFVTVAPLLKAWANTADVGLKSTDDVAVISDSETFYTSLFGRVAACFSLPSAGRAEAGRCHGEGIAD
ncbi:hypothetical protein [Burkholderia cenocepacia]|uniref:hypothetical protein n=1 Tax=Burkholderia cenocepacia TaxID=95486 RepID=UPI000F596DFE|nr:hypothetical protein [Burkholderia cenocepacia]MBR8510651.1 hypothetical protein [Burkholderia cenocepacia]